MSLKIIFSFVILMLFAPDIVAKDWSGIIPLKSNRTDVERRFGKPDERGGYEFKDQRVNFEYAEAGPCRDLYLTLGKDNCKCLVEKDTIMSIFVEPTVKRKFSDLKLDLTGFQRTAIAPFPYSFEYDNKAEGIYYNVDESEDQIKHITYYPSPLDCQQVIRRLAPSYRNSWRGLVPLHANRADVEKLLGPPQRSWGKTVAYDTDHEVVTVKYSQGSCGSQDAGWNVPNDTVVELVVGQRLSFLLSRLNLDLQRYERHEQYPIPAAANPSKVVNYIDKDSGIDIRVQSNGGPEEVVSITYLPAAKDETFRCQREKKSADPKLRLKRATQEHPAILAKRSCNCLKKTTATFWAARLRRRY